MMRDMKERRRSGTLFPILITLVPVLFLMIVIFILSAENAEESGQTSSQIVRLVMEWLVPHFGELSECEQIALAERATFWIRKAAHFSEFAALGFFLCLHLSAICRRTPIPRYPIWAFAIGSLYGVTDEIHQLFVPGRSGECRDMLIDSIGVLAGTAIMAGILRAVSRKRLKQIQ